MAQARTRRARKLSLRTRLFLATVALVAVALGIAAMTFERAARGVIVEAVHSHLDTRAKEIHDAVQRFQRERALTVRNWTEAEAMQMTLDLGDPKFAEDYLRRVVQDQAGTVAFAALVGLEGGVKAAVRPAAASLPLGYGVPEARGLELELPAVYGTEVRPDVGVDVAPLSKVWRGAPDTEELVLTATIKDF